MTPVWRSDDNLWVPGIELRSSDLVQVPLPDKLSHLPLKCFPKTTNYTNPILSPVSILL